MGFQLHFSGLGVRGYHSGLPGERLDWSKYCAPVKSPLLRLGFGVWGLGFGVWGLRFGVWVSVGVLGFEVGAWGLRLGFGVWGSGFVVWGSGVWGSGVL